MSRFLFGVALLASAVPAGAEMYLGVYIGGAATRAADVTVMQADAPITFRGVPLRGRSFESPVYYGYRAGYYFTRYFGVEAEFIHLKIYADLDRVVRDAPMRLYFQQFEVSHGLNMVLVNAVIRRVLVGPADPARARLFLVGRGGAGPTIPRPEVIVSGVAAGEYQLGPVAIQGSVGVELRVWRGLHAFSDYKYTYTPSSFDIPNGRASVHVHSHHVIGGVALQF